MNCYLLPSYKSAGTEFSNLSCSTKSESARKLRKTKHETPNTGFSHAQILDPKEKTNRLRKELTSGRAHLRTRNQATLPAGMVEGAGGGEQTRSKEVAAAGDPCERERVVEACLVVAWWGRTYASWWVQKKGRVLGLAGMGCGGGEMTRCR
jgi:hypothetical protein